MILVFGSAYAGKREYVKNTFSYTDDDFINGEVLSLQDNFTKKVIYNTHLLIKNEIRQDKDMVYQKVLDKIVSSNIEVVIIDEAGSGIIPIDTMQARLRENIGKFIQEIGKLSHKVVRVYYGYPIILKG